jgi:hypothetical protein
MRATDITFAGWRRPYPKAADLRGASKRLAGICVLMDERRDSDAAENTRRRDAMLAFLGAGMHAPPSRARMVAALADARRSVAAHQATSQPVDGWLANEIRLRGVRESAAVLAVLEIPERRAEIADAYRQEHPERASVLDDFLAVLGDMP